MYKVDFKYCNKRVNVRVTEQHLSCGVCVCVCVGGGVCVCVCVCECERVGVGRSR